MKPNKRVPMNINISIIPSMPNSLKLTAQGYIKITSTSNSTNNIATKKYLIENGHKKIGFVECGETFMEIGKKHVPIKIHFVGVGIIQFPDAEMLEKTKEEMKAFS